MADKNNLYSNLANFYNLNDKNFNEINFLQVFDFKENIGK